MKKILLVFIFIFLSIINLPAQDTLLLNIREVDATDFAKIKIFLNISDTKGKPVLNYDANLISIEEKNTGKKVSPEVMNFYESEKDGIAICFIIDASPSMEEPIKYVKAGLLNILDTLRKQDKIAIGYFNDSLVRVSDFTTNRGITRDNLNLINATNIGGTRVYKSIIGALQWIKDLESPKRKILIIISDGDDTYKDRLIDEVIKEAKKSGVTVYTIGAIDRKNDTRGTLVNMEKIGESTKDKGGKYYEIKKAEDIKQIIPMIYTGIKESIVLTYWSCANEQDTVNLSVEVKKGSSINVKDSIIYFAKNKTQDASIWTCKKKEIIIGIIVIGALIIILVVFLILNLLKKRKYRVEKEEEKTLREQEARVNQQRYDELYNQYQDTLNSLESQRYLSQSDKEKIMRLEQNLSNASKTLPGISAKPIDTRRRTMLLTKSDEFPEISGGKATLLIRNGTQSGQQITISEFGLLIGRNEGGLIIQDVTVSRRHAKISVSENKYFIEDLNTTNGTFVNGIRTNKSVLNPGDILKLGNIELLFNN